MIDFKVIIRKVFSKASGEEDQEFNHWLNESKSHKDYFNKVTTYYETKKVYNDDQPDVDQSWEKVADNLSNRKKFDSLHWIKLSASIAAAMILFFVGYVTYKSISKPNLVAESISDISPGTKGAVLVLSTGETIELGTDTSEIKENNGTIINTGNGELFYDADDKLSEEIELYNEIHIGKGEEYRLVLADGTRVTANAMSMIRYPVKFTGSTRKITLEGEAYFEVAKNKEKPFIINSGHGSVKVLGTEFNVKSYPEDQKGMITLAEGLVELTIQNQKVKIVPGQQAVVDIENHQLKVNEVDVRLYTAWKDGSLMYRDSELWTITKDLSKWYDVNFEFMDQQSKNTRFSLFMSRQSELNVVLDLLASTNKVTFELMNNTIFIKSK